MEWLFEERNAGAMALLCLVAGLGAASLAVLTAIDRWREGRTFLAVAWLMPILPVGALFVLMWAVSNGRLNVIGGP